jgi:predicted DNA-binding WGR domain protein
MKKYFEYQDDKSSKFWEITIDGVTLKTRYGKMGTAGQTTEKTFANETATQKEYDKLIKEKTSKGYVEMGSTNNEAEPPADQNNKIISNEDFNKHLLGYNIIDCAVRKNDFLYFLVREDHTKYNYWKEGMEPPIEKNVKKRIVAFLQYKAPDQQWSAVTLTGCEQMVGGISFSEPEQFVSMDYIGRVYAVGSGSSGFEGLVDPDNTGLHRGTTTKLKTINNRLYACATGRTVGWREGTGKWQWFTKDIPFEYEKEKENAGFEDIDGNAGQNIYAVGGKGDVWTFDGAHWQKCSFPSDIALKTVCCTPGGSVYISGFEGETYQGEGDVWKQIAQPKLSIPFQDMVWYEDRVWCTNEEGIWWIKDGKLEVADVPPEIKIFSGNLSTRDGVLLLAGSHGAAMLQNGSWKIIFNHKELSAHAETKKEVTTSPKTKPFDAQKLLKAIEKHNKTNHKFFGDDDGYNVLTQYPKATEEEITQLQQKYSFQLPDSLLSFYKTIGGLYNHNNDETHCIEIPNANKILSGNYKINGIIDAILESWGNDREEFSQGAGNFSQGQIDYLNSQYKCVGYYHNEEGIESANYIFFDTQGNFGDLFYYQDDFSKAYKQLVQMAKENTTIKTLEEILIAAIKAIETTMKMDNE